MFLLLVIIGFSTVGQENRYKRETGDETVDNLVVQLERKKKTKKNNNKKTNYLNTIRTWTTKMKSTGPAVIKVFRKIVPETLIEERPESWNRQS